MPSGEAVCLWRTAMSDRGLMIERLVSLEPRSAVPHVALPATAYHTHFAEISG